MTSRLCKTFRARSAWTWRQIAEYAAISAPLSETTVTEQNVKVVKQRCPGEVETIHFNQVQEGYLGGDWEWWFHGITGFWSGFRIQAKIFSPDSGRFEHLHYRNSRGEYQSDLLARSARAHGVVPLYCLYSQWRERPAGLEFRCGSFRNTAQQFGCSLVTIEAVFQLRTAGNLDALNDVAPFLFPWHCLVCCRAYGSGDLAERTFGFWGRAMRGGIPNESTLGAFDYGDVGPRREPPPYLSSVLRNRRPEAPDRYIAGITVITESSSE